MSPIRVLVVDDEPLVRGDLARMLAAEPDVSVVGEARNGLEALDRIESLGPDVVFLDVQMPELDGLGVVTGLPAVGGPAVVFVTAFDRYALQAFEAHAVDYLLKPFDRARCRRALDRARLRLAGARAREIEQAHTALLSGRPAGRYLERIAARGSRASRVVELDRVRWIEAADNYVRLHEAEGSHLTRRTMRELEAYLDPARFVRIHRSAIVNLAAIRSLAPLGDGDVRVILVDGTELTLTRGYRARVEALLGGLR
jgi:two-component system LytT family response regulator